VVMWLVKEPGAISFTHEVAYRAVDTMVGKVCRFVTGVLCGMLRNMWGALPGWPQRRSVAVFAVIAVLVGSLGGMGGGVSLALAGGTDDPSLEQQLLDAVNGDRAQLGLAALVLDPRLTDVARTRSRYMLDRGIFSHCADGLTTDACSQGVFPFVMLLTEAGLPVQGSFENLARDGSPAATAAGHINAAWLASAPHHAQVVNPVSNATGIGVVCCTTYQGLTGIRIVTQIFDYYPRDMLAAVADGSLTSGQKVFPASSWWAAQTGHSVSGDYLRYLKANGDVDNVGLPRTEIIADPVTQWPRTQYFQRLVLDSHDECRCLQRRLLGDLLYPGSSPAVANPNDPNVWYFSQTGHTVSDVAPDGTVTGFKAYFDSHGREDAFAYPKEEPVLRNGRWTQRFQAAVFEYHAENAAPYTVELELLGDEYMALHGLTGR